MKLRAKGTRRVKEEKAGKSEGENESKNAKGDSRARNVLKKEAGKKAKELLSRCRVEPEVV